MILGNISKCHALVFFILLRLRPSIKEQALTHSAQPSLSVCEFSLHFPNNFFGNENKVNDHTQTYLGSETKLSQPVYKDTMETVKENSAIRHGVFGSEK